MKYGKNDDISKNANDLSKLTMILYDICFGKHIDNIKFRFIGNIRLVDGYYKSIKEVLIFLFDCSNILKKIGSSEKNLMKGEVERKNQNDDLVFKMEYKNKEHIKKITDLNKTIEKLKEKLIFMEKTYKLQIDAIKEYFNFNGDINILLSGRENTEEMKYAEKIRNFNKLSLKYEKTIGNLEDKLSSANEEIKRLKIQLNNKETDQTMINYYLSVRNNSEEKLTLKNNKNMKELFIKIDELNKEICTKNKIIDTLKKDLDKKNNIFCNLPKSIINQIKQNIYNSTNNDNVKNKSSTKEIDEFIFQQEIQKMKINEQKYIQEIKDKYNYILLEKKKCFI